MTEEQFIQELFTTTIPRFTELSIISLFLAFLCRLFFKEIGFEYLKIMSAVIVFAFTLEVSFAQYKVEQTINMTNCIVNIKTSTLSENEKETYIKQFSNEIESLKKMNQPNFIFSMAKLILLSFVILIIADTLKLLIEKYKIKKTIDFLVFHYSFLYSHWKSV